MKTPTIRNKNGLTERDLTTIFAILAKFEVVETVFLFGSRAKGTHRLGSDIDLAIMNDGATYRTLGSLESEFEDSSLPYFVDVVRYPNAPVLLQEHINRVGVLLYQRKK